MDELKPFQLKRGPILPVIQFPPHEQTILITNCPTIWAQLWLRDKRIEELEAALQQAKEEGER
jgi:hypothetical protein